MQAFLEQTEEELEYLESQVLQLQCLLANQKCYTWTKSTKNGSSNLVCHSIGETKNMSEDFLRMMRLQQLKQVVFKIIIGIERVELYITGKIRGRDSMLRVLQPAVQDLIPDTEHNDPFDEKFFVAPEADEFRTDILGVFPLQQKIFQEIRVLEENNIKSRCLTDRLRPFLKNKSSEPDKVGIQFDQCSSTQELKKFEATIKKSNGYFKELTKWQKKAIINANMKQDKRDPDNLRKKVVLFAV